MIKKILFTGGGGVGNESIWKSLNKKYKLFFCDSNIESINPIIPKKNKITICPVKSKNYLKQIKKIIDTKNIDLIVPGIDEELLILKKNEKNLTNIFLPSLKNIKICNDKYEFSKFCKKNDINTPKTSELNIKNIDIHNLKVILKPKLGRGSKGIFTSNNKRLTKKLFEIVKLKKDVKKYIIQDYIVGQEYTVTCIKRNNNRLIFPVKIKIKKGITKFAEFVSNRSIEKFCNKVIDKLKDNGIYNMQLIKIKNKFFLFEINPRVSTTFCMILINKIDPFNFKKKFTKPNPNLKYLKRYIKNYHEN